MNIDKIREILGKEGDIVIALSNNYDYDEVAAGLSLYLALRNSGKNVQILSSTPPLVEVSNLVGIDKLKTQYAGKSGDLVVSFPYVEGEIEKISYTMENGLLNIVVKSAPNGLSFNEKDVNFKRSGQTPSILITVGVASLPEISGVVDTNSLSGTSVINIDNKADNQGFGDVALVSQNASSVSELVADMIYGLGYRLDPDSSQNLVNGISTATNNFQSPNTSGLAFEMAGILMRNGAKRLIATPSQNQSFPAPRPQGQNQNRNQNQNKTQNPVQVQNEEKNPPQDWLAPKIFKGSSNVE